MSRPRVRTPIPLDHSPTWNDLLQEPEGSIAEIINGELILSPRPNPPHARATSDLGTLLGGSFRFGRGGPGGWVFVDEPRIRFDPGNFRAPDLAAWRRDTFAGYPDRGPFVQVPDWICEVLSPSTERADRTTKMALHRQTGVKHVWLLDPYARTLEVFRLESQGWLRTGSFANRDLARAEPFDAIEIDLTDLWDPIDDDAVEE